MTGQAQVFTRGGTNQLFYRISCFGFSNLFPSPKSGIRNWKEIRKSETGNSIKELIGATSREYLSLTCHGRQAAKAHGARVIGTASGPEHINLIRKLGCDEAIDYMWISIRQPVPLSCARSCAPVRAPFRFALRTLSSARPRCIEVS